MLAIPLLNAESKLPSLVKAIEQGEEQEIIITRDGKPVARLVPILSSKIERRIGVAKGLFEVPDSIDKHNSEVAALFLHSSPSITSK